MCVILQGNGLRPPLLLLANYQIIRDRKPFPWKFYGIINSFKTRDILYNHLTCESANIVEYTPDENDHFHQDGAIGLDYLLNSHYFV